MKISPLKELGVSFLRTSIVPPAVGFVATWLLKKGITVNTVWLTAFLTFIFSAVWYILFRGIEILSTNKKVMYWAGIALGYPRVKEVTDDKLVTLGKKWM